IHIMIDGRIVKSGGRNLAQKIEEHGYAWLEQSTAV
ncbi:MAG: Fe-S cluster assembly ATPase SufC, partial [Candidatus Marinimicrobia bacterium]|nr:Fe-S cluster assembly ATPase SufC [Candidatus Neomarinimicrobiota bacterium]